MSTFSTHAILLGPLTIPENLSCSHLQHLQIAPYIPPGSPSLIVSNSKSLNLRCTLHFGAIHTPMVKFLLALASATPRHLAPPLSVPTCSRRQSVLPLGLLRLSSSGLTLKTSVSRVTHISRRSSHQLLLSESLPLSLLHTLIALKSVFSLPP